MHIDFLSCTSTHVVDSRAPLLVNVPDFGAIDDVFTRLGPTPRISVLLREFSSQLAQYEADLSAAITDLDFAKLHAALSNSCSLNMTAVGHKMFLICRKDPDVSSLPEVLPMSSYVSSLISERLRGFKKEERIRLMQLFSTKARSVMGDLFEVHAQDLLQDEISIEFHPMIRLDDAPNAKEKNQWHSVHSHLDNPKLESKRQSALNQSMQLKFQPKGTLLYQDTKHMKIQPDILYLPKNTNQVAFDSFIVHASRLYIFQFTVSPKHLIKEGLIPFLTKCDNLPGLKADWFFIFVISDDVEILKSPLPRTHELQEIRLFSAIIKVMQVQWRGQHT